MRKIQASILLVGLLVFACNSTSENNFQSFVNESFPDLDIATIQNLETPYEALFSTTSGRVSGDIVNLAEISDKLAEIFPDAELLEAELETERGLEVWEIKLKMPSGGIVKIRFLKEIGEIIKMKGKPGPYDYEIDPEGSFIAFSEARELALNTVDGEIAQWTLELEENNEWEYEFHIIGADKRFEVEIKGFEATVISVKEKHEDEDKDNDGEEEGEDEDKDDEKDEDENTNAPEAVVNLATEIFDGEVIHSEEHNEDAGLEWKLYLENASGAIVKFIILDDPVEVKKIEGEKGPFDYNIILGDDLLTLKAALEKVFSEVEGELTQWELKMEHNDEGTFWQYEFEVTGATLRYKIEMNAHTGEITKFDEED
jgi:uncharacterized membrane protein YkoI